MTLSSGPLLFSGHESPERGHNSPHKMREGHHQGKGTEECPFPSGQNATIFYSKFISEGSYHKCSINVLHSFYWFPTSFPTDDFLMRGVDPFSRLCPRNGGD
jgi:hypothetical protein